MLPNLPVTLLTLLTFFDSTLASNRKLNAQSSLSAASPASSPVDAINSNLSAVAAAWYPGWNSDAFPVENISWDKYNVVTYAFGVTTTDVTYVNLTASNGTVFLPSFVQAAHDHGALAFLSIGGWTGSQYFSTALATTDNRTQFVKTVVALAQRYNLDGIDFDWEYPNDSGIGCNTNSMDDTSNFLSFLQELREDPVGSKLKLSAAVATLPFKGADGHPITDVSEFAKVLDWISIMAYDIWGAWSKSVGPNALLNGTCGSDTQQQELSVASAVEAWTAANLPSSQIVLGVAAYGRNYSVQPLDAINSTTDSMTAYPPFDDPGASSKLDQCGVPEPATGEVTFRDLIDQGFLGDNGEAMEGILYRYDNCSKTPYVYNQSSHVMVSYDDAQSFRTKGQFINDNKLLGFSIWASTGDDNDILLDSISKGMNLELSHIDAEVTQC